MSIKFPENSSALDVFGKAAFLYGPLVNEISSGLLSEVYKFEPMDRFESMALDPKNGRTYMGQVYWREILFRSHMASIAAIYRTTRWADVAVREYQAEYLFGWAAACRSLLESSCDIGHSLASVPLTLARYHRRIRQELKGKGTQEAIICKELEDALIHFSHGRKVNKEEHAPESHRARAPWEYLKFIDAMRIEGAKELYAELCEIVHPAARSVSIMFGMCSDGLIARLESEPEILRSCVQKRQSVLSDVLMAAYNPPLLMLRVLHRFGIFAQLPSLKRYRFDAIPAWRQIEKALQS